MKKLFSWKSGSQAAQPAGEAGKSIAEMRLMHQVPVTQPFLLVSEVQRSGGTLMSQLLDGHPQCFSHPSELRFNNPKWIWPQLDLRNARPEELFESIDENWIDEFLALGYYHKTSRPDDADRFPFLFDRPLQRELFAHMCAAAAPTSQRQLFNYYLTSLFNGWLDYQNLYNPVKRFITAFVPRVIMVEDSVSGFFRDYPDGYMVTLIRHPASWYSSAMKHEPILREINKRITRGEITEDQKLEAIVDLWKQSTQSSLDAQKRNPERIIVLLFEDVVLHTEAVMRSLCARVGLDYDPVLTRPTYNSIPVESNSHYNPTYTVDTGVATRYKEILGVGDIQRVESMALELYEAARRIVLQPA